MTLVYLLSSAVFEPQNSKHKERQYAVNRVIMIQSTNHRGTIYQFW